MLAFVNSEADRKVRPTLLHSEGTEHHPQVAIIAHGVKRVLDLDRDFDGLPTGRLWRQREIEGEGFAGLGDRGAAD
jgi:hypothetical protein